MADWFSSPLLVPGRILVDGRDIRSYNVGWLRSRLAVVRQDPVLFAATIAENIRYGNPMIQQNDIEQAAIAAQAHKFILKVRAGKKTLKNEEPASTTLFGPVITLCSFAFSYQRNMTRYCLPVGHRCPWDSDNFSASRGPSRGMRRSLSWRIPATICEATLPPWLSTQCKT